MKRLFCITFLLIIILGELSVVQADFFKEAWYMSRGKANMKIKNYHAAIEAFEKLVEIDPDNQEAMQLLGLAYENQGLTTKAVEHYDRYLKRFPKDAAIAFKQAKLLEWSRFKYRRKDAIKYYRMGLAQTDDPVKRHRLAKLLAEDKKNIAEAIREYRILVENDPKKRTIGNEYRKILLWEDRFLSEAIDEYERAAQLYPNDFAIQHQLAELYYKDDDHTDDAISQYKIIAAKYPASINVQEEYAHALAKSDAHFEEAERQFKRVLKKRKRFATRLAYANLLAKEESTRKEALRQYKILLRQKPDKTEIRLKYASLLSSDKRDLNLAVKQYKTILKNHPKNVSAHQGIAHVYAWKGDNDRAVYHTNLALEYQPKNSNASRLRAKMMEGREPTLSTEITLFNQGGDDRNFDLHGLIFTSGFRADITPFVTGEADIGYEKFWKGDHKMDGNLIKLELQYRPDVRRRLNGAITLHNFDAATDATEFDINYEFKKKDYTITPGIRRTLKYDSLTALGCYDVFDPKGKPTGTARSNMIYCELVNTAQSEWSINGSPYAGIVNTKSTGDNLFIGLDLNIAYQILKENAYLMSIRFKNRLDHYQKDYSGFSDQKSAPYPGGYFSPHLLLINTLAFEFRFFLQNNAELTLCAGPGLHYVKEASENIYGGADVQISYLRQLQDRLYIKTTGEYEQIADTYRRITFTLLMNYTF